MKPVVRALAALLLIGCARGSDARPGGGQGAAPSALPVASAPPVAASIDSVVVTGTPEGGLDAGVGEALDASVDAPDASDASTTMTLAELVSIARADGGPFTAAEVRGLLDAHPTLAPDAVWRVTSVYPKVRVAPAAPADVHRLARATRCKDLLGPGADHCAVSCDAARPLCYRWAESGGTRIPCSMQVVWPVRGAAGRLEVRAMAFGCMPQ